MAPDDLGLLVAAAEAAGAVALAHFKQPVQIWEKPGDQGPVTEADLAVNRLLHARLNAARPDYGWLSEESEDTPARQGTHRVFIVDPIDGTRAFIAGQEGFAVALAVADRGRVVAAVVHLPARGETYAAALGQGAERNGAPLAVSPRPDLAGARALVAKTMLAPEHWPGGVPQLDRQFRTSLAWRLCLVAAGEMDLMLTFRDTWEWDAAAGALIAAEAGAVVSDRQGAALGFNSATALLPGLIVAPPALHRALLAARTGV